MLRRAIITALIFGFVLSAGAAAQARTRAAIPAPRFCFSSVPLPCSVRHSAAAATQLPNGPIVIAHYHHDTRAERARRNVLRLYLAVNEQWVQTSTTGAQGMGSSFSASLRASYHRFSDELTYTRFNTEIPTFVYCPTCGGFFAQEEENDDYYTFEDFLDYLFGPPKCKWGVGPVYEYIHPVYSVGGENMSGFGIGIEHPPTRERYSLFGDLQYLPSVSTNNSSVNNNYKIWNYNVGLDYRPHHSALDFQLGFKGETWIPSNSLFQPYKENGGYLGIGYRPEF